MRFTHSASSRQQFRFLQRQFLQDGDLPFTNVLTNECLSKALDSLQIAWKDRVYTPLVTLWVFLGQVLSADHSCRAAVVRFIAHRCSQGLTPCSPETGAYCQARKRLPEQFFSDVARHTGQTLDSNSDSGWLWKNRRVYILDGSTVTMPDTEENQDAYPQNVAQEPGLGFPIARIVAVFSLACGAIVDLGICRYAGKGQGELSVFRTLWNLFQPTDIALSDCLYCTWTDLLLLKRRGVDSVTQLHTNRKADFRRGTRLGKDDHIVRWRKPNTRRWVDRETYTALFLCSTTVFADDMFQPLDTRTRCIVLFRECLVLIDQKDVDGIFEIIADGGASDFKLYPDPASLSPELKQERQDVDGFIERNFRSASLLNRSFYKIQFSDLTTANKMVTVINTANDQKDEAKLHSIKIKIKVPDTDRHESVELRFLEIAEDIYWIPIGW